MSHALRLSRSTLLFSGQAVFFRVVWVVALHRDHMRLIQIGPYIVPLTMRAIAVMLIAAAFGL
jgi:hypothetical protein